MLFQLWLYMRLLDTFMPAIQQIYSSLTQLKFISPVLDSLYKDLINLERDVENQLINKFQFNKSIKLNGVYFSIQM